MEVSVQFAVIDGSREWNEPQLRSPAPVPERARVEDVHQEARRRLKDIRLDEWRTREFITGRPMPDHVRHMALQIEFAAKAIERLMPIPADYANDVYWPRVWDHS
jgi:hypothetical protein